MRLTIFIQETTLAILNSMTLPSVCQRRSTQIQSRLTLVQNRQYLQNSNYVFNFVENGFSLSHVSFSFQAPKTTVSRYIINWTFFYIFFLTQYLFGRHVSKSTKKCQKNLKEHTVHYTSWKDGLYFACIFRTGWNFLIKFCSSDPSFNRNNSKFLYLKFKTSAHAHTKIAYYYALFTNFLTWYEF